VSVTQSTTNAGGANSVNLINSSVNVQSPYSGSIPTGADNGAILPLTLEKALALGLRSNLGEVSQSQLVTQAQGQRQVARSTLLPNVNTAISEELEQLNLRTEGVESSQFPLTARFNFFDARAARLTQAVVDFVRLENLHSANKNLASSIQSSHNARDLIVLAVGGSYLQLIATTARIVSIYQQAADRLAAGLNAHIDATRSQVQLQTDQQRLRSLQADLDTQKLRLAHHRPPARPAVYRY
jgi:outer membrane protein TolC